MQQAKLIAGNIVTYLHERTSCKNWLLYVELVKYFGFMLADQTPFSSLR